MTILSSKSPFLAFLSLFRLKLRITESTGGPRSVYFCPLGYLYTPKADFIALFHPYIQGKRREKAGLVHIWGLGRLQTGHFCRLWEWDILAMGFSVASFLGVSR